MNPLSALALAAALLGLAAPARADGGCAAIGWSVKNEQGWFADKKLPHRVSGGARLRRIDRAVDLELKPLKQAVFFLPPEKEPKAGTYAGTIAFFGVPRPATYQVTLSAPAELDVFENGMRIRPLAVKRTDCPDARVSARYALQTGDLVLVQVSNAAASSIKVAFEIAAFMP